MVWLRIAFILLRVTVFASIQQTDKFEYECDVLARLDRLENELQKSIEQDSVSRLKLESVESEFKETTERHDKELASVNNELDESKERLQSVATEIEDSTKRLENVEHELQESREKLENVEKELKKANESQAVAEVQLEETLDTILTLQNKLEDVALGGSMYVRWGRTSCPGNGTELVYSGSTGGSHFDHSGAAANYLCLPDTPGYGDYTEDASQRGGYVYGARYVFGYRTNPMDFFPDLADGTTFQANDVPCAVCNTHRSTVLMVPAQNTCMDGWTLEYKGLLFTGYFDHAAASEYICLDDQPEFREAGGSTSFNGKLMYFVESHCGTLPCPPYVYGRELACVVCSK